MPTTRAVKCRNITQKNRKTTNRNFKIYRCQQFRHYTSEHPHRSKNPRCLQPIFRPFCTHQRDESEGPRHASLPSAAFGAHWASAREEGKGHVEAGGRGVSSKKLGLSFVGKSMKGRFFIRGVFIIRENILMLVVYGASTGLISMTMIDPWWLKWGECVETNIR